MTRIEREGEAMPSVNRRRMLLGLAAASTAAATATVAAASGQIENPELIRLGDDLPAMEAEYVRLRAHEDAVKAYGNAHWPETPAELLGEQGASIERDFCGAATGRYVMTTDGLGWRRDRAKRALRSKAKTGWNLRMSRECWEAELDEMTRLCALAEAYEAECTRIRAAADYTSAWKAVRDATKALAVHVTSIMSQPDATMSGLLVKAEALAAWGRVEWEDRRWAVFEASEWHGQIAASMLRHAEGVVS